MHEIARRAIETTDSIESLVIDFYGPNGPLAARGWEIRSMQREMSIDIARQMDARARPLERDETGKFIGRPSSWGIPEAPCGTGKSAAYAIPGILGALRARETSKTEHSASLARYNKACAAALENGDEPPKRPQAAEPAKLVITTANIALQEQIVRKDVPAIAEMLDVPIDIALLKGRNNYLCRWKIRTMKGFNSDPRLNQVLDWMKSDDCDGDKEAMRSDIGDLWGEVSATTDECLGQGCAHYGSSGGGEGTDEEKELGKPCFWREAVKGFKEVHVVVTNHHYLTLARPIRSCLLAVDEMHELENSLRSTQGRKLTDAAGRGLVSKLEPWFPPVDMQPRIAAPVQWLMLEVGEYFKANVSEFNGKPNLDSPVVLPAGWLSGKKLDQANNYADGMVEIIEAMEKEAILLGCFRDGPMLHPPRYRASEPEIAEKAAKAAKVWTQLTGLHERYAAVVDGVPYDEWPGADGPWAIYAERFKSKRDETVRFSVTLIPADVSWAVIGLSMSYPCAVLTSATVPDFASLRLSLGLLGREDTAPLPVYEKRLPSPYPLDKMAVLVVPRHAHPSKDRVRWAEDAACTVVDVVRISKGGVLVLASSNAQMWAYAKALRDPTFGCKEYPVKVQGEAGRGELREWFKTNQDDGVLCATKSFFQGLDVQGDNCRVVIIDRIPFGRPDDPVENAVAALLVDRAGGGSPFDIRSVPQAAMVLAQGAGRLIRSQTDRGALVIMDPRIIEPGKSWGVLRAALPPFPVSRDIEDVGRVLAGQPLLGALPPPPPPRGRSLARKARSETSP